jgi:putative Holliday junction resolvase
MGRILGVDYGRRRVGLALSDPTGMLASSLKTLNVEGPKQAVAGITAAAREAQAVEIVIGLPLNMDGSHGPMAQEAAEFARRLEAASGLPVKLWDERLTTGMAERVLLDADLSRERRKAVRDKLAAQLILQGYLDSRQPAVKPGDEYDDSEHR